MRIFSRGTWIIEKSEEQQRKPSQILYDHVVRSLKKEGIRQATTAMIFERTYATLVRYNIVEKFGGHLDSEDAYQILINYFFSEEHLYEETLLSDTNSNDKSNLALLLQIYLVVGKGKAFHQIKISDA